jgi:hypothetical protein
MADGWTMDDIDACAMATVVDLLDALIDGCAMAQPGRDAGAYSRDLRYLGDSAAMAVIDLQALLIQPVRRAVA